MPISTEQKVNPNPGLSDFQSIIDRNIFSTSKRTDIGAESNKIESLEPTTLKISLIGTIAGDQRYAAAIIEETDKRKQALYRVGDSVQEAVVKAILRGKVVLRVGDKDEILIMAAHAVHENRYILLGEILQLKLLIRNKKIDWDYIMTSAKENNWLAGLYLFLALSNKISTKISREEAIPEWFLNRLAGCNKVSRFIAHSLVSRDAFANDISFPVVMPFFLTSLTFVGKFFSDLKEKNMRELGREFIAYTLVDWLVFWRFKKDLRKLYEI